MSEVVGYKAESMSGKGCGFEKCKVAVLQLRKDLEGLVSSYLVGSYTRNYSFYEGTFFPFKQGNKWYALYSKDYMYTRVMSLPDCKDLGGEDDSNVEYKDHFCPTEYFVPTLILRDFKKGDVDPRPSLPNHDYKRWCRQGIYPSDKKAETVFSPEEISEYRQLHEKQHKAMDEWWERHELVEKHADFGFVAGCAWGDDTSWKVQFLDLTRASEGIINRDQRFGYIELCPGATLKDTIDIIDDEVDRHTEWSDLKVRIAVPAHFNVYSGKRYQEDCDDWWDNSKKLKDE